MSEVWTREPAPAEARYWVRSPGHSPYIERIDKGLALSERERSVLPVPSAEEIDRGRRAMQLLQRINESRFDIGLMSRRCDEVAALLAEEKR